MSLYKEWTPFSAKECYDLSLYKEWTPFFAKECNDVFTYQNRGNTSEKLAQIYFVNNNNNCPIRKLSTRTKMFVTG